MPAHWMQTTEDQLRRDVEVADLPVATQEVWAREQEKRRMK